MKDERTKRRIRKKQNEKTFKVNEKRKELQLPMVQAKRVFSLTSKGKSKMRSMFGERTEDILDLIENNNRDGAVVMIYKQLLKTLVDIIPISETLVRKTEGTRGIYQLNQLLSQIRELLADMQAVQDRGLLGRQLISKYVRPGFLDIAMQIVQNDHRLLNEILPYVEERHKDRVKTQILSSQRELGKFIQEQYKQIAEDIIRGLT
jgi:hypothetical protein